MTTCSRPYLKTFQPVRQLLAGPYLCLAVVGRAINKRVGVYTPALSYFCLMAKETKPNAPELAEMPVGLIPVYTDKAGATFYAYERDYEMPFKRFFAAQIQDRFIRLGVTESYLKKLIRTGIDLAMDSARNERELREDIIKVWHHLEGKVGYMVSEDIYLRLAAVFFLLPGEPLEEVSESWTRRKLEMWEADDEAKGFFLQTVLKDIMMLPGLSSANIPTYIQAAKGREESLPALPKVLKI